MKKLFPTIMIVLLCGKSFSQTVTWSEDVACIINTHCIRCHNNTSSLAAIAFTNYQEGWNNRNAILYYVQSKLMPPYLPDNSQRRYIHEKSLTQNEIDLIVAWVNQGAVQGDSTLTPPNPIITPPTSVISSPDFSQRIPAYTVPNVVGFQYHNFVFPTNYSVEKHISQLEVLPTNTSAVYSAFLYSDTSHIPLTLDAADTASGYEFYGNIGSSTAKLLYGWVNGNPMYQLPLGMTLRLEANAHLVLRLLFAEDAQGKTDSTLVRMKFDTAASVRIADIGMFLCNTTSSLQNPPFIIPADSVKQFHEQYTVSSNISLLGISPWTHKLCDNMMCYAVTPANDTLMLMDVQDHGDLWSQGYYYFDKPIKIPTGSLLIAHGEFNNTGFNPDNPFFPAHTIYAGLSDTTEAMQFSFLWLPYQSGDENIVANTLLHMPHYLNCIPAHTVGIQQVEKENDFKIYPNPTSDNINIISPDNKIFSVSIFNSFGQKIYSEIDFIANCTLPIANYTKGLYFIQINSDNKFFIKKIIKQ